MEKTTEELCKEHEIPERIVKLNKWFLVNDIYSWKRMKISTQIEKHEFIITMDLRLDIYIDHFEGVLINLVEK